MLTEKFSKQEITMYLKALSQSLSRKYYSYQEKQINLVSLMLLLLSGMLQFVFSLSHTIALRNFLLIIAFLLAFRYFWEALQKKPKQLLPVVILLVILQAWMLAISGIIADQPSASFSEWKGQWLPVFMSFVIGIGLARGLAISKLKDHSVVVAMSILIPITIFLSLNALFVIHDWIQAGKFIPSLGGLGDHHGISGYLIALLEPILFADILSRLIKGNRLLPVSGWVVFSILILAVCTLIGTTNRNGILSTIFTLVLVTTMILPDIRKLYSPRKLIALVLVSLVTICAIALISYKTDPRWQNFIETVTIAWDIDHNQLWLNGNGKDPPSASDGKKVDTSEYSRIAWAHEGWRMLIAHPWGTEISRDTFHKLVQAKYGHAGMSHSHNSWIDFGLEVGVVGVLLWGWVLLLLAKYGWSWWRIHQEPLGLAFAVLVIMFAVRGMMDSIFRDHEIVQFMMVAGLLLSSLSFKKTDFHQP